MNLTCLRILAMLLVATLLLGACAQAPAASSVSQPTMDVGQMEAAAQELPTATARRLEPAGAPATDAPLEGAGGSGEGAASEGTTIIVATDEGYDSKFAPASLEAPANTLGTLIFKNISTIHHNLLFPAPISVKTKLIVAAGASDTITFTTPAAGNYKFYCSIHPGMEGTLQVK
jgi:plastocyanin